MKTLGKTLIGLGVGAALAPVVTVVGALAKEVALAPHPRQAPHEPLLDEPTAPAELIRVVADDGSPLNVMAYGPADGEVIVLSHGWTCQGSYWYPQINAFADRYRVVVYDQRGHGLSPVGSSDLTQDRLAADLAAVLEAVVPEGKRALIGGHSMGGMSILSWARNYPEAVEKYARGVLLASTGAINILHELAIVPTDLPSFALPLRRAVASSVAYTPVPVLHSPLSRRLGQYLALDDHATAEAVRFCEKMMFDTPTRVRSRWARLFGRLDVVAGLDALTVPTTIVVGDHDRLTPRLHADMMAERLRAHDVLAEYEVLTDTGHMSTVESAHAVNESIARLLAITEDAAVVGADSLGEAVEHRA